MIDYPGGSRRRSINQAAQRKMRNIVLVKGLLSLAFRYFTQHHQIMNKGYIYIYIPVCVM